MLPASLSLSRYDLPQYGSRRKLISPSGLYDEYGEVVVDDDGSYYYSPQESDGEVNTENYRRDRTETFRYSLKQASARIHGV